MINFKETITGKGTFYFIKVYEGKLTVGFTRVSKDKFISLKKEMSTLFNFSTRHKQGIKTEHFCSGKVIHKLIALAGTSYF